MGQIKNDQKYIGKISNWRKYIIRVWSESNVTRGPNDGDWLQILRFGRFEGLSASFDSNETTTVTRGRGGFKVDVMHSVAVKILNSHVSSYIGMCEVCWYVTLHSDPGGRGGMRGVATMTMAKTVKKCSPQTTQAEGTSHQLQGAPKCHPSAVQYSTVQFNTVQYSQVQHSTVQYSTVQYSAVQFSTVQYSTVQYSTVQCSAVPRHGHRLHTHLATGLHHRQEDFGSCDPLHCCSRK